MQLIMQSLYGLGKLAVVLVINVSLFLIIPIGQNIFGMFSETDKKVTAERHIVAEYIKPAKTVVEKQKETRLRRVNTSAMASSLHDPMKFKFSPDLSVASGGDGVALVQDDLEAEVFDEGDVDVPATPLFQPPLDYPEQAQKLAIQGDVDIVYIVDAGGKVSSIESVRAPHVSFSETIRDAAATWKFKPAMKKGVPVKCRARQLITFLLD